MNAAELTGRARTHVREVAEFGCALHADAAAAFAAMCRAARADGIDLAPASAFRDFARQLAIWNGKFRGERPLQGAAGTPLDACALPPDARIDAILLWSALPGASRHHWGTDLDLIDRGAIAAGHVPRLTPDEYAPGGPFAAAFAWLERHAPRYGFFRPYRGRASGVQPEPWHYSFAPVAEFARRALGVGVLREALASAPIEGRDAVLARLDELHARYVAGIDPF